jgi:metal-sulfur cluster biosynthetic enzyme
MTTQLTRQAVAPLVETEVMGAEVLSAVTAALGTVRDPELDESIVDLGFVLATSVQAGRAEVRLRLPTYFCAPNFAFLMVADAHDAVSAVAGITSVSIILEEHFASSEINAGVAAGGGFVEAFGAEASGELAELRANFQRKAHTASLERACRRLLAEGWTVERLATATLGDLPEGRERAGLLRRRADINLPLSLQSALFVLDDGTPVPADKVPLRLRFAQTVRVSIDGNAHFCRGLLTTRYPEAVADQRPREFDEETGR